MSIKTSQAILKCFIDLKSSVWFILYKVSTLKCKYAAIVASPCCLVELLLAIFWAVFTGFSCFLVVTSEINFLCLSKNL